MTDEAIAKACGLTEDSRKEEDDGKGATVMNKDDSVIRAYKKGSMAGYVIQ